MQNITRSLSDNYIPKAALIAYKNEVSNNYYLETRTIDKAGYLGYAKPVSRKFMHALVKNFRDTNETTPHGMMPPNMLFADSRLGKETYIWWTKPQKVHQNFSKSVGMPDETYNMPGCIFIAEAGRLKVFCFSGPRPSANKYLLHGPFYNYYENGDICLGSAKVEWSKDITWEEIQKHFEKLFWASENSHMIFNPMKDKINLNIALKQAITKPFDTSLLQPCKKTLNQILKEYN